MEWTEDRTAALKIMWHAGLTATEISRELGDVSRDAVIGMAHTLNLEMKYEVSPALFGNVADLPLSDRTQRAIRNDNIIFIGDLVQKTEAEMLRMPDFGRKSLNEVKVALNAIDLRLGMWVPEWPPENFEDELKRQDSARRVSQLRQARGGATFQAVDDRFAMASEGDESDLAAALQLMTQQMQSAILNKARSFANVAARLDNQPGWIGIGRAATNLIDLLDRPPADIPEVLGLLYPSAIELGSFVEFDEQLVTGAESYAAPLDPEVRRPLTELVRLVAPWLRAFPSIREADDQAGQFLTRATELSPTYDVIDAARSYTLLAESDLEVFRQLRDAANRGVFQGEKAGGRAKRSASNLVISAVAYAGMFFSGAVSSDFATTSPLVHKVGQFLVSAEISIEELIADLPQDLRYSILEFVKELPNDPLLPTRSPHIPPPPRRPLRAGDRLSDQDGPPQNDD